MFSFVQKISFIAIVMTRLARASPLEPRANVGDAFFYEPGLGACGITNLPSDFTVAVSAEYFNTFPGALPGVNPNLNPICGRTIQVSYQGRTIDVQITDICYTCAYPGGLDLTPAAFSQFADPSVIGIIHGVTWSLL